GFREEEEAKKGTSGCPSFSPESRMASREGGSMAGRTTFEFELGTAPRRRRPDDEDPMRILVMGDFGGRAQHAKGDLARRKPAAIDVDHFERVIARIAPRLLLGRDG